MGRGGDGAAHRAGGGAADDGGPVVGRGEAPVGAGQSDVFGVAEVGHPAVGAAVVFEVGGHAGVEAGVDGGAAEPQAVIVGGRVDEGGGAFYGPKIDLKIKDALGRPWQLGTIQFDFNLPERFDMTYVGEDGKEHQPYMVHRALLGSLERFFGILIEHYAGAFPVWLAPEQVRILPITSGQVEHANALAAKLREKDVRVGVDADNEKLGAKIRRAQLEKVPFMLVIGGRDVEAGVVSVRSRETGDKGAMTLEAFEELFKEALKA